MDDDPRPLPTLRRRGRVELQPLFTSFLVGRSLRCDLQIDDRVVSSEHARIDWNDGTWEVRDLGSRNGTFVDGQRLGAGSSAPFAAGSSLIFGAPRHSFEVVCSVPPRAAAVDDDSGDIEFERGGLIALSDDPPVSVQRQEDGSWILESDRGESPAVPLSVVTIQGRTWRLHLPEGDANTAHHATDGPPVSLSAVELRFRVSRDEERVQVELRHRAEVIDLGQSQAFYVLLTLARLRRDDTTDPPDNRGWVEVDELLRMLRTNETKLNVDIHRCRKRLATTPVQDAARIVERRRGTRQLRFGAARFTIVREPT